MIKTVLLLVLVLTMSACASDAGPIETEASVQSAEPTETALPVAATVGSRDVEIEPSDVTSETESAPVLPVLTPDQVSIVRPQDHFLGTSTPVVTIIEYGDFQ